MIIQYPFPKSMLYKPWDQNNPRWGTEFTDEDRQILIRLYEALRNFTRAHDNNNVDKETYYAAWDAIWDAERYFKITEDDDE